MGVAAGHPWERRLCLWTCYVLAVSAIGTLADWTMHAGLTRLGWLFWIVFGVAAIAAIAGLEKLDAWITATTGRTASLCVWLYGALLLGILGGVFEEVAFGTMRPGVFWLLIGAVAMVAGVLMPVVDARLAAQQYRMNERPNG